MREIEPEEKAAAKERMRRGGRGKTGGKLPPLSKGKSRDKAAKATGRKARTLAKAAAVVEAAGPGSGWSAKPSASLKRRVRLHPNPLTVVRSMSSASFPNFSGSASACSGEVTHRSDLS
jgi:hypothetical protein